MKVTLEQLSGSSEAFSPELWQTKRKLLEYRKSGEIFFREPISSLNHETEFELYYHLTPSKASKREAFPIPLHCFEIHKNDNHQYLYLKEYFESYYEGVLFDLHEFKQFQKTKPFMGNKFVWYDKSLMEFS